MATSFYWMELTPLDMFIILSLVISLLLSDDVNYSRQFQTFLVNTYFFLQATRL